ncbi:MAG: TlpA disulfide reductase family protein [Acidimicrobiia bacterium]
MTENPKKLSARERRAGMARARARRRAVKRVGVIAGGVAVFATIVALSLTTGSGRDATASVTDPARFDLPALDGDGRVRLADFRGTPTVVNFFASWCTQCDAELPAFRKVSRQAGSKVTFVGVNSLETGDPFVMPERHGITSWPLAGDVDGSQDSGLHDALCQCNGMPITAFYSADGELLSVHRGVLTESALREQLADLFAVTV